MSDLSQIPEDERKHFIKCDKCGEWIDRRDLNQVFNHDHDGKLEVKIEYTSSRRIGDAEEWHIKDGIKTKIELN